VKDAPQDISGLSEIKLWARELCCHHANYKSVVSDLIVRTSVVYKRMTLQKVIQYLSQNNLKFFSLSTYFKASSKKTMIQIKLVGISIILHLY
jgi:hypothetical protein